MSDDVCEQAPSSSQQTVIMVDTNRERQVVKPFRQVLRKGKRLSKKYSFGFLALVLAGLAIFDLVYSQGTGLDEFRRLEEESALDPPDTISLKAKRHGAVILHCMGLFYMFIAIALVCDECFVPALEVISEVLDLSPDVAGATFMAAGGSAPEFFTSLIGSVLKESDIGTGTIIGSAVFNVLFVIGACALVAPEPLQLTWFPLARDSTFYSVALIMVTAAFIDETVKPWEAAMLFIFYICYAIFMKYSEDVEAWTKGEKKRSDSKDKPEQTSEDTWAEKRQGDESQVSSDVSNSRAPSRDSAGTGEGGSQQTESRSPSHQRLSTNGAEQPEIERKHFRHKSIRVANHLSLLAAGIDDQGLSDAAFERMAMRMGASPQSRRSLRSSSNISNQRPDLAALGLAQDDNLGSTGGTLGSTGGSADPVPSSSGPKMMPEWELTDVVPSDGNTTLPCGTGADEPAADDLGNGEEEDEEPNEPLSIYPPGKGGSFSDWFWYCMSFPILCCLVFTIPDVRRGGIYKRLYVLTFFMAIVWIFIFTWIMVWFATAIAETCGLEEHIMGLTILAAGTSVPDLLTSMIVAREGHGDMAISSSIGSNIFDVTVGLPVPWLVACAKWGRDVSIQNEGLEITVLLLLGMLAFTIGTILWNRWVMTKWMGGTLLFLYLLFEVVAVGLTFAPPGSLRLVEV